MTFDRDHLAALAAVLRLGSFEGAAAQLGLTQPAVSLRIKALEDRLGVALVRRGSPCTGTKAGKRLARHAEEIALLERATLVDLTPDGTTGASTVSVAINADSLATWFPPVLGDIPELTLDVQIDDQDHSADWLTRGDVSAAVTGTGKPVAGCDVTPLGAMRYVAVASPGFAKKWFADGVTTETLSRAPVMAFNMKDRLQASWMYSKTGKRLFPPSHRLPSTHAFVDAALQSAGWGMNPISLVEEHLARGALIALDPALHLDVPLYWQISRRMKAALAPLDRAVKAAARRALLTPHVAD